MGKCVYYVCMYDDCDKMSRPKGKVDRDRRESENKVRARTRKVLIVVSMVFLHSEEVSLYACQ